MDVKTYMVDPTSGMCIIPRGHLEGQEYEMVLVEDFDRVTTERDALQQLLNARDEEVDSLRADAGRYRWMKANVRGGSMGIPDGWIDDDTDEWDESIDRYIQQENQA